MTTLSGTDVPASTPASAKATISNNYRWRLAVIGIGFTLFGLYCLYDGAVAYPKKQEIFEAWAQLNEQGRLTEWPALALERGWSDDKPKEITDMSILTQYIMAAIVFPIGVIFTVGFVRSFNRYVAMDETGLSASGGHRCRFDQVTALDSRRWKTKGIAVVQYRDDANVARSITLDDWKFDRQATTVIYQQVAQHLGETEQASGEPAPSPSV